MQPEAMASINLKPNKHPKRGKKQIANSINRIKRKKAPVTV